MKRSSTPMIRANEIAFACGTKGSGKSHWLHHAFVAHAPRVIHIDPNGELLEDPNVLPVDGYDGLLHALRALAACNEERWRLAVCLDDPDDIAALFALVCPREDFGRASLARAFGGLAIECGECDVIAPNGATRPEVANAWRRGRHHRLDLYMGTQRPAACDRLLTSQADIVSCFYLDEPIDLDWCAKKFGRSAAEEIKILPEHWHVEKRRGAREMAVVDANGTTVRALSLALAAHAQT